MNVAVQAPAGWSPLRWIFYIAIAFVAHVGLIFAFGSRKPIVPREVIHAPTLQLTDRRSELQTLDDPTLFAMPHPQGFAAESWLPLPQIEFAPFRWSEPAQLLAMKLEQLGATFLTFTQTNNVARLALEPLPLPERSRPEAAEPDSAMKHRSTVRVSGGLTDRRWLNQPAILPSWPAPDLLTNSIVRILTDADGQSFTATLMPPGSGSKPADQLALDIARNARFAPNTRRLGTLTVGTIIFEWHTVPVPDTNAPANKP